MNAIRSILVGEPVNKTRARSIKLKDLQLNNDLKFFFLFFFVCLHHCFIMCWLLSVMMCFETKMFVNMFCVSRIQWTISR